MSSSSPLSPDYAEVVARAGSAIASLWYRRGHGQRYVVLPDGQTDLLFRRTEDGWRGYVVGPLASALVTPPAHGDVVGVRLTVGAARAVIGESIADLAGKTVAVSDLGLDHVVHAEFLDASARDHENLRRLGLAISSQLVPRAHIDGRVLQALRTLQRGAGSVRDVAREANLSERHLLRLFRDEIGLTPKQFANIARLRRALGPGRESGTSWASVAASAGYADEAHLARECRLLTGTTPTRVERAMSDSFNAGHVLASTLARDEQSAAWPEPP